MAQQLQYEEQHAPQQHDVDYEQQQLHHDAGIQLNQEDEQYQGGEAAVASWRPIEELPSLVPCFNDADIKKLQAFGCHTVEQTLQYPDRTLTNVITETKLKALRQYSFSLPSTGFVSGLELGAARAQMAAITSGSIGLDNLLGGGIEAGAITELYGEFNTGKSQLCHTICVNAQFSRDMGGASGRVLFIDTEGTFRPERILEIARAVGATDPDAILDNIQVARALNSDHQTQLLSKCGELMAKDRYCLLIVDSVTALFRTDYVGRGNLADRQVALGKFLRELHGLAHTFGIAVVITNQVVSDIAGAAQMGGGDNKKPIGGNILAHASTVRIQMRKGRGGVKIAKIVDSPSSAEGEASIRIGDRGILDAEDE